VIDGLRAAFTGKIIVVPSSPYGQFENTDILSKKFTPIQKNEVYMVEEDYLDRANIDVIKGELKTIDLNNNIITIKGVKE
jgi:predicted RNA-binding protein